MPRPQDANVQSPYGLLPVSILRAETSQSYYAPSSHTTLPEEATSILTQGDQYYQKNLSFFKAFKTLMRDMIRIEQVISDGTLATGKYLMDFLQLSRKKHILEKKNLSNYSVEILVSSLTITVGTKSL